MLDLVSERRATIGAPTAHNVSARHLRPCLRVYKSSAASLPSPTIFPVPFTFHHHTPLSAMSVNIVLPDLPNWVQQRINTLYGAKTTEEFDDAFDAFIAKEVTIKVNGKLISRDEYKKMVQGEISTDVGAQVTFNGIVSVPSESKDLRAIGVSRFLLSQLLVAGRRLTVVCRLAPSVRSLTPWCSAGSSSLARASRAQSAPR